MKPVFFSAPERCVSRDDALVGRLVELWEASVRATHDFLPDSYITLLKNLVLTRYLDKRVAMMWLMGAVGVVSCAMYFVPSDQVWALFAINTLIGLLLGPKSPLAFSMYADCADYTEWKTGRRATAMSG